MKRKEKKKEKKKKKNEGEKKQKKKAFRTKYPNTINSSTIWPTKELPVLGTGSLDYNYGPKDFFRVQRTTQVSTFACRICAEYVIFAQCVSFQQI